VSVRDELSLMTPRLRRYARALMHGSPAPSDAADELVHAAFMRMLDAGLSEPRPDLALQVYAHLTQLHRETRHQLGAQDTSIGGALHGEDGLARTGHFNAPHTNGMPKGLSAALGNLRLEEREALLLVALEGFSYAQAARILHISRSGLLARLGRARGRVVEALSEAPPPPQTRRPVHLRVVK
jgi:RNA polymerase sigma-70 factor, ECF subfamily